MPEPRCGVLLELLVERYLGEPTGRDVYHVSEASRVDTKIETPIRHGCPLGRGYSPAEAMWDFCFRANLDDPTLKLKVPELVIVKTVDNRRVK